MVDKPWVNGKKSIQLIDLSKKIKKKFLVSFRTFRPIPLSHWNFLNISIR